MNRIHLYSIAAGCLFSGVFFAACSHDGHDHAAEGHDHDAELAAANPRDEAGEHGPDGDEIVFPASKAKAAGVETARIKPSDFSEVIRVSGKVIANPGGEATVAATRSGIVRLARPWAQGMAVGAGTTLFSVSSRNLPDGDPAAMAKVNYDKARADLQRIRSLHADKLISTQELRDAEAACESARIIYESNNSGASSASVSAPKSGYVLQCLVKDGDFVEVGTPLMTITQNRRLRLQADLPMRHVAKASEITSANFSLSGSDAPYELSALNGHIISRGQASDGQSAYVPIIFEFDNAPGIAAGAFAEVYLLGNPKPGRLVVPKSALVEESGVYSIFIRLDSDCYEKRHVEVGVSDGANVEILSGLKEGEEVVTKGAINVKLASASTAIPGHTHNH